MEEELIENQLKYFTQNTLFSVAKSVELEPKIILSENLFFEIKKKINKIFMNMTVFDKIELLILKK